ncbi:MAG: hypothetical protein WCF17_22505 [Terracidiphilus sp.]
MKNRISPLRVAGIAALAALIAMPLCAQKRRDQMEKPIAGPRATPLQVTWLYVSPDKSSQKLDRVQIGREMVVAERSGPWLRVFANTDIEEVHNQADEPEIGDEEKPPISGWVEARGIVEDTTSNGDQVIMGEAENQEAAASDPRGPANAAQNARLLYRRLAEMFPASPLAAEAAWRAADIEWQIQKADASSRPSAKERDPYMRDLMDEDEMKRVIKDFPRTPQADLAAFEILDNKMCGDWQGQEKCPERESVVYEKYADDFPDGPRTAKALYEAAYRQCVLVDMYQADNNDKKAGEAKDHAHALAARLKDKFPQSDDTSRATDLVFKIDQGIPVYGINQQ